AHCEGSSAYQSISSSKSTSLLNNYNNNRLSILKNNNSNFINNQNQFKSALSLIFTNEQPKLKEAMDIVCCDAKKSQYNNSEPIPLKISSESNNSNNQTLVVETYEYSEDEYELSDDELEESKGFLVIGNSDEKPLLKINNTQVKYQNESFDNYNFHSKQASDSQTIKYYFAQPQKTCPKYIQVKKAISCFTTKEDFEETNLSSENNLQLQQFLTE
ncbi:16791_t:CDS:2, partial [Racocetra persica]